MEYLKDKKYIVEYITNKGEEKEIEFIPNKDMNIANVILEVKNNNKDFLKLKNIKDKKEENLMNNTINNLYELLEARKFEGIDIADNVYDMIVYFEFDADDADKDSFDTYLAMLAKSLKITQEIDNDKVNSLDEVKVNLTEYVKNNYTLLESIFDFSTESEEEGIEVLVSEIMPSVISGYATDSVYNQLVKESKFIMTENKKEEFEELEDVDTKELKGTGEDQTETQEAIEQAVSEVENPTREEQFAVQGANDSIDVLIADEETAIDGYKGFLKQCKDTIIPSLYEVLEKEINEIIADEEDHINKLNTIKASFHLEDIPLDESKKLNESIKHVEDLEVGDEVTIPYARGPKYTQDRSQWVKGKVIDINPDYVDLEVPTTLTVSTRQLSDWMSKNESKKLNEHIITSSGQEFGDKYNELTDKMSEVNREFGSNYGTIGKDFPNKYKDKLDEIDALLDIIASENKGKSDLDDVRVLFDLATIEQQEDLRKLVEENKNTLKEDHQLYYDDIQEMSTEERHKLWMTEHDKDFTDDDEFWDWAEEEFPMKDLNENKCIKFDTEGDKEDYITNHNLKINVDYKNKGPVAIELLKESNDTDKETEHKYNIVLDIAEVYPDSPQEEEDGDMIMDYIKNHPEKSADEIAQLYLDYLEDGDTTILESKSLKESDNYNDLETKMEEEVYNYLLSNDFDPFDLDPDDSDAENQLNEIIEDFQSDIILDYMENHDVELTWECNLDHFKPYGIKIHIWEV